MKRIISYVVLIIICTTLGVIGLLNKPSDTPDKNILNTNYYKYNYKLDTYEILNINEKEITYNGELLDSTCSKYKYNKETQIMKLDCKKAIKLKEINDSYILINIDDTDYYFYKEETTSYQKEFENYFKVTEETYINEGSTKIKEKMINLEELNNKIKDNNEIYVYLRTTNCTKKCALLNNNLDLLTKNKEIYVLEYNEVLLDEINKLSDEELTDNILNKENPVILKIENKKITEIKELDIKGFNIELYNNYLDNEGALNE